MAKIETNSDFPGWICRSYSEQIYELGFTTSQLFANYENMLAFSVIKYAGYISVIFIFINLRNIILDVCVILDLFRLNWFTHNLWLARESEEWLVNYKLYIVDIV